MFGVFLRVGLRPDGHRKKLLDVAQAEPEPADSHTAWRITAPGKTAPKTIACFTPPPPPVSAIGVLPAVGLAAIPIGGHSEAKAPACTVG